jgi:hypothetical protein
VGVFGLGSSNSIVADWKLLTPQRDHRVDVGRHGSDEVLCDSFRGLLDRDGRFDR